jgi:hypothetical protein
VLRKSYFRQARADSKSGDPTEHLNWSDGRGENDRCDTQYNTPTQTTAEHQQAWESEGIKTECTAYYVLRLVRRLSLATFLAAKLNRSVMQ